MVDLEQFREAVEALLPFAQHDDSCGDHDAYNNSSIPSCGCGLDGARDRLLSIIDSAGGVECAKPAPVDGESTGALTMGQRAVAFELLRCCESWEPNVCVLGNVRAKDAADLMRSILAHQPAPVVPAFEVFRIAGGDTECEPNPTPERALEVLRDLRACYDEALCDQPAPVVDDAMRVDAERYRWLRDKGIEHDWTVCRYPIEGVGVYQQTRQSLDAAIDAARAQGAGNG